MSYRVLVVDDSKLARMAVAKALTALHPDWTRVEAANADEALALAKTDSFDIAILDFNMPGRDGLALAAELLALKPGHAAGGHLGQPSGGSRDAGARGRRDLPAETADRASPGRIPRRRDQAAVASRALDEPRSSPSWSSTP